MFFAFLSPIVVFCIYFIRICNVLLHKLKGTGIWLHNSISPLAKIIMLRISHCCAAIPISGPVYDNYYNAYTYASHNHEYLVNQHELISFCPMTLTIMLWETARKVDDNVSWFNQYLYKLVLRMRVNGQNTRSSSHLCNGKSNYCYPKLFRS